MWSIESHLQLVHSSSSVYRKLVWSFVRHYYVLRNFYLFQVVLYSSASTHVKVEFRGDRPLGNAYYFWWQLLLFNLSSHLLYDLEDLTVIGLGDDELVHVLLTFDVHGSEIPQILLANSLLPAIRERSFVYKINFSSDIETDEFFTLCLQLA